MAIIWDEKEKRYNYLKEDEPPLVNEHRTRRDFQVELLNQLDGIGSALWDISTELEKLRDVDPDKRR